MDPLKSLEYIKENLQDYLYNHDSTFIIIKNEIKRIIELNDKYLLKSLEEIVKEECEISVWSYWRTYIKHSEKCNEFNIEIEVKNKIESFWEGFK